MSTTGHRPLRLDYGRAGVKDLLGNISGVAVDGSHLWTVSDEGRTFECLAKRGDGYSLQAQYCIDDLIENWPGRDEGKHGAELDLESIDVVGDVLWLCGSHCHVRARHKGDPASKLRSAIRVRPSRHLLARIELRPDRSGLGKIVIAPRKGARSLRGVLSENPFLKPFVDLPSKENGLDIEGLMVVGEEVLIGLRGPRLDNNAVVVHLSVDEELKVRGHQLSFLDLNGLAVRDLGRDDGACIILAGPVGDARGPFALYRWKPNASRLIQHPELLYTWPIGIEKPEGVSIYLHNGAAGYLIVYDSPNDDRTNGSVYWPDWVTLS